MNVKAPQDGPLEEQRDALLARIHASRASYREQLHAMDVGDAGPSMKELMHDPVNHPFPRSQSMRWLLSHPWLIAGGVAALVIIGPRRAINSLGRAAPLVSSAAALITTTLQDPAKMRVATRGLASLTQMIRSRR